MSNSSCKVIFPDGFELYSYGDCTVLQLDRLYDTPEAAREAYCNEDKGIFDCPPRGLFENAEQDDEPVICMTLYGTDHRGVYKEMLTQNARASRRFKVVTVNPHYDYRPCQFGYGDEEEEA